MHAISLPNGLSVWGLSKTDTMIVYQEIFEEGVYEKHGLKLKAGDCVLDIGANTGLFAVYLGKVCPAVRFFGFEPVPPVFEVMQRNVREHTKLDAKLFNFGLSREAGQATFVYYPRMSCASTMFPDDSEDEVKRGCDYILNEMKKLPRILAWPLALVPSFLKRFIARRVHRFYRKHETVTCPLRTASEMIRELSLERVDLLKVDAERSELDILSGIAAEDWPRIRQVVVEVHEDKDLAPVEDILRRHGFQVVSERHATFHNISMLYCVRPN